MLQRTVAVPAPLQGDQFDLKSTRRCVISYASKLCGVFSGYLTTALKFKFRLLRRLLRLAETTTHMTQTLDLQADLQHIKWNQNCPRRYLAGAGKTYITPCAPLGHPWVSTNQVSTEVQHFCLVDV